ncbi:hypothetical protein CC80DRAFT_505118 [Byssothecium circinans]|uniref:Ubiquitin 3 binding protein But2 C-terminal domain-containing protein n=1 Tax=Byssothecium circinans TaxID=147558 RepID=A0A6A5TS87_9PLEO|nr:hypothetical protein CC80DRAFT_505118 [Byssothecium circinans]
MYALALVPVLFGLPSLCGLIDRQFPHLIVPVDKSRPNVAINTQKSFDIERDIYTEFLFDVPASSGAFCDLRLTINTEPNRGAPWQIWGPAEPFVFNVSTVSRPINKDKDTWSNHPAIKDWVATYRVYKNGHVEQIGGQYFQCAKGNVSEFIAHPVDLTREGGLKFYELDEPLHGFTYEAFALDTPVKPSQSA